MFTIKKMQANHVVDFAAEELKKYLRMMMPECGDIEISFSPNATDGFRLGLLEDFHLKNEAIDPVLDDVVHVEVSGENGIFAGSNSRSILFSVYRFFKENGCRFLYPGIDGEYIPMQDIHDVSYHKMADHRFRGFCNEGSESQTCMLECADYYAKLEMNVYMLEWFVPNGYYNRFYAHLNNEKNRIPEPVDDRQILQWKRQCETEIAKRGLMFHDIGHGWTCRPFGFPASNNLKNQFDISAFTEEDKSVLALIDGKREFFRGTPIYTNLCMSQQRVRDAVANEVVEYAATHQNIDYLHVWLSDGSFNHCECEECQKMRPSDWYLMILNQIDSELTKRNLDTRIVFIAYLDTIFSPEKITLNNPNRFSLLYAPISRSYTSSISADTVPAPVQPYVRNHWKQPSDSGATLSYLREWQKCFDGPVFMYEYHFWRHQFLDPGGISLAKRIYEDIISLKKIGVSGYVEDGSQRSGFPNAFPVYVYAQTLLNAKSDFDEIKEDYFSHVYGPDWKECYNVLSRISTLFDFAYMEGEQSKDSSISRYYDPERVKNFKAVFDLCAEERNLALRHLNMPFRPQTVSWRLLLKHAEYCELWAQIMIEKCLGHNFKALELIQSFSEDFGKCEIEIERYYDHSLACRVLEHITSKPKGIIID